MKHLFYLLTTLLLALHAADAPKPKPNILCNSAVAAPGLQLITAADLKNFWRSDHYGVLSKGVLSRPAFIIDHP